MRTSKLPSLGDRRISPGNVVFICLVLVAVAFGVLFRFYHLDRKVYSGDEVYTTLKMLGDTEDVLVARAPDFHRARDLWLVLHPTPPQGAMNPLATVHALALEEPQHPPVYYLLGHYWLGVVGNSIAATRALSATISLLELPLAFWLGVELFGSRRAGCIALILSAVSPVCVLYAQEAREYALWTVVLLAVSIAFRRAFRLDRPRDWWLVAVLSALGLYVYPLTFLVLAAFVAYGLVTQWPNRSLLRRCALAIAGALLAFAPWSVVMFGRVHRVTHSLGNVMAGRLSLPEIMRTFAGSLRLNVFDTNLVHSSRLGVITTAVAVLLLLYAVVFVLRRYPARVTFFLLFPLLACTLPLLIANLFGGQSVKFPRYFISCYLYLDFFLVGLLAATMSARNRAARMWGYLIFTGLLGARIASIVASSQAVTWWNKMEDDSLAVAKAVNAARQPIVASDELLLYPLALANYLRPDVGFALRPSCYLCTDRSAPKLDEHMLPADDRFTDVFALGPSPQLQSLLHVVIARRHLSSAYHCINVRNNCVSNLNVEPVFAPIAPASDPGTPAN